MPDPIRLHTAAVSDPLLRGRRFAARWCWVACALLFLPAAWGCEFMHFTPKGVSPLAPIELSKDSVALEVIFIRFPFNDAEFNEPLWKEIDEQEFPAPLRRELAANGLRIGLIGAQMPALLAKKLSETENASTPDASAAKLESDPIVRRWRLQCPRGQRGEIITSKLYDELSLLVDENGEVHGRIYSQAQGLLVDRVYPQSDGRVRLSLTPELRYGENRQQWVGEDGIFRLQSGKPKQSFDRLKIDATLSPNQMLVLASLPQRSGSLGHYLLTEPSSGRLDQKLLIIRLADTKFDDLFADVTRPTDAAKPADAKDKPLPSGSAPGAATEKPPAK